MKKILLILSYVLFILSIIFLILHYVFNLNFINNEISFLMVLIIIIFCFFTTKFIINESWKQSYKSLLKMYLIIYIILVLFHFFLIIFGRLTIIKEYKVNENISIQMAWYDDMSSVVPPIEIVYKRNFGLGFNCYSIIETHDDVFVVDSYDLEEKWNEIKNTRVGICGWNIKK